MNDNNIINGDCIEELKKLPDNSVDAIITDPPYGLEFMGKDWDKFKNAENIGGGTMGNRNTPYQRGDKTPPAYYIWTLEQKNEFQIFSMNWAKECLRVLKPGAYLLSFGGTRTYHRMVCGIEDAGFEIRDCIMWIYGSGFPKSLNIGKQIDKIAGRNSEKEKEISKFLKERRLELGLSMKEVEGKMGWNTWLNWIEGRNYLGQFIIQLPNWEDYQKLKEIYKIDNRFDEFIKEAEREVIGKGQAKFLEKNNVFELNNEGYGNYNLTAPATPEAKEWEGWGTALKPACEPIVVARKHLSEKNVALNVLKWGTGGINIDECRIPTNEVLSIGSNNHSQASVFQHNQILNSKQNELGRFPANIILDEEAGKMLDEQSGIKKGNGHWSKTKVTGFGEFGNGKSEYFGVGEKDTLIGGASRFFYCPKASKSERNNGCEELEEQERRAYTGAVTSDPRMNHEQNRFPTKNNHPTVKPVALMEYLIKLVSKEGAIILDPFLGSGTTAIACLKLNRNFIGIEKEPEYIKIAEARIKPYLEQRKLLVEEKQDE